MNNKIIKILKIISLSMLFLTCSNKDTSNSNIYSGKQVYDTVYHIKDTTLYNYKNIYNYKTKINYIDSVVTVHDTVIDYVTSYIPETIYEYQTVYDTVYIHVKIYDTVYVDICRKKGFLCKLLCGKN